MRIAILSLIYRSPRLADWLYDSLVEFTPMLRRGEATFLFVANDPTEECARHLESRRYPHIVVRNPIRSRSELFQMGYAAPEYMHRVYRAYNQGIRHASTPIVVLINSDNFPTKDWLENLEKYLHPNVIVTSRLVEPGHPQHGVFPEATEADFGRNPESFDKRAFLAFVERTKETGIHAGGAYMPCMVYREQALRVGLYPEGNLAGRSFDDVRQFGDEAFFGRLRRAGIHHVTAMDSIVYHLKEGEAVNSQELPGLSPRPASARAVRGVSRRSSQIVVRSDAGVTHLGVDTLGFYQAELHRLIRLIPKTAAHVLRPLLPRWAFEALQKVWHLAKRIGR